MDQIINHILQLKQKHHITKLYVDMANPEVIRELKRRIDEDLSTTTITRKNSSG